MKISTEVKIGIIFVVCLFVFIWGINFLKGQNIFSKNNHYYTLYDNVKGITESSPVTVHGYQIGQVDKIILAENNQLVLKLAVVKKFKIPVGSVARIISADFMGTKAIEMILADDNDYYKNGDTINTSIEPELKEQINNEIGPIKDRTENILVQLDSLIAEVFDKQSRESISGSFSNLHHTTENLNEIVAEEKEALKQIFSNLESISSNLEKSNQEITQTIQNLSMISDSVAHSNLKEAINNTNDAVAQLSIILETISSGEGTLGKLVHNDTLYRNIEASTESLDKLLEDMRLHPKRYVHFSIFGRKDN